MPELEDSQDKRKQHRARQSGVKAEKKKAKKDGDEQKNEQLTEGGIRKRNPKAFAINSVKSAEQRFRRTEDLTAKRQHIPLVDQTPDVPPPALVAVVGPPKVGKTTLIKNLISHFTRTTVTDVRGPITVVTAKKRRITLLECNNDICSMIDVAKCADLVLLLADASYKFEMDHFEFLNICQVHGMPKILGVLTHLDMIKNPKELQKKKKEMKHRFWKEVYDGAKLFYLSGILHGKYLRNEIKNLSRFIAQTKFRPLEWRSAHSYMVVDRVEDMTNTDEVRRNPKCDRQVLMYGYVRGVPLKQEHMVHIAGLGDMRIDDLSSIPDPCPLPGTGKKRSLLEKERLLYGPMSGISGIVYDKDALYIDLKGSHSHKEPSATTAEQQEIINEFNKRLTGTNEQMNNVKFELFAGEEFKMVEEEDGDDDEEQSSEEEEEAADESDDEPADSDTEVGDDDEMEGRKQIDNESSSDEDYQEINEEAFQSDSEDEENSVFENNMRWKENIAEKARDAFLQRHSESQNLMRLVYGVYSQDAHTQKEDEDGIGDDELGGGLFKKAAKAQKDLQTERDNRDKEEHCFFEQQKICTRAWLDPDNGELIRNCFVTGQWNEERDASTLLKLDDMSDADSDVYGDFEDVETGERHAGKPVAQTDEPEGNNERKEGKATRVEDANLTKAELRAKKLKLKAKFDAEYDNKDDDDDEDNGRITGDHAYYEQLKAASIKQSEFNKSLFANVDDDLRMQIEGHRPGLYARLGFKTMPAEFIQNFDGHYPILIGALNLAEENVGYVNVKIKKHRWYSKILKSSDPLIISMGWRRFQTRPIYAKVEDNFRHRFLKYTPNHITCSATFWGPITPQKTGILAVQSVSQDIAEMKRIGFRIAATGCVTELDQTAQIMKKLKLVGHPFKIYKKSAFIKDMFTSALEVAKFEGAKIKTVAGLRGQIKKAHHTPPGSFRATFEDKILLSDIVFCRTWYRVEVPRFYAPVTTLLLPPGEKSQWQGMKTLGQLKRERDIRNEAQPDSMYTDIVRRAKVFKPLTIPKALQRALPYKYKPKYGALERTEKEERVAIINSPYEQKVKKMMKMIDTNYKDKRVRENIETKQRVKDFKLRKKAEEMSKLRRQKEVRKKISRAVSKMRGRQEAAVGGS